MENKFVMKIVFKSLSIPTLKNSNYLNKLLNVNWLVSHCRVNLLLCIDCGVVSTNEDTDESVKKYLCYTPKTTDVFNVMNWVAHFTIAQKTDFCWLKDANIITPRQFQYDTIYNRIFKSISYCFESTLNETCRTITPVAISNNLVAPKKSSICILFDGYLLEEQKCALIDGICMSDFSKHNDVFKYMCSKQTMHFSLPCYLRPLQLCYSTIDICILEANSSYYTNWRSDMFYNVNSLRQKNVYNLVPYLQQPLPTNCFILKFNKVSLHCKIKKK